MPFVYVLLSDKTQKKYVGHTSRTVLERLKEHNAGTVPWTSSHRPFTLLYTETFTTIDLARKRELFFKSGKGRLVLQSLLKNLKTVA